MTLRFVRARAVALPALAGLAVLVLLLAFRRQPYALTIVWSAVMLGSFVGWGSLVNLWLGRERWADWGLRAGWGMALFLLTGGYLLLVRAATGPVLVGQVAVGLVGLLGTWALRRPARPSLRRLGALVGKSGVVAIILGAFAMAGFTCFAYLGNQGFQPSDDPPLYFTFAEKLVQTGSIFEPFAARRITTFGGQVYLHAAFISVAPVCYLHVVDAGLSLMVVTGLLVGGVGCGGIKARHAAPLGCAFLLLFSLEEARVNTASLLSGVAAILTVYRTVRAPIGREGDGPDRPSWPMGPHRVVMLAALTVACILLRTSNAAAVLPFVVLILASDFTLGTARPWTRHALVSAVRVSGLFAGVFVVALLPWSILLRESVGTFFYPLGHSNLTPGWTFLEHAKTWDETANNLLERLAWNKPLSFLPFAIAGLVPLAGRARNDLAALSIASLIGVFALSRNATAFYAPDATRYSFAYFVATALVVAASVRRLDARAALVAAALGMHLATSAEPVHKRLNELIKDGRRGMDHAATEAVEFAAEAGDYREVQRSIPAGAVVATAVREGWQLDFKRNEIFALDVLGGMGPRPGWPSYRGPTVLGDYLQSSGVKYLVWVDFGLPGEFYNRAHWQAFLSAPGYLQGEAKLQLDAMDAIEKLTAVSRVVYRAHGMTVVDLSQPHGP